MPQEVKQKEKEPTCSLFIKRFPRSLRSHFRAWCALRNVTMRDKLVAAVREIIKDTKI